MTEQQQEKLLNVVKHLVTLAIASLGFVITMMFASAGGEVLVNVTEYKYSLQTSLILFLCAVIFGFLTEAAILSVSLSQKQRIFAASPIFLLILTWTSFVFGATALVVFALATAFDLPSLSGF